MIRPYAACEEIIDHEPSGIFTVRDWNDTNPHCFMVHGYFDTFEEAHDYIDYMQNPQDYFNLDE